MKSSVLILGANGRFGRLAVAAFADAGWTVFAQARRPLSDQQGGAIRRVALPVTQTEALAAAAAGAGVVVNAMNPLYTRWDTEALPLNAAAIAVARSLGATLMLPGNVYNFGAPIPAELREDTPQRPTHRKAQIRCDMEAAMRTGAPRSVVVRAGDFFGGPGTGSWMDQAILKDLAKGRITYPGPRNLAHAWAYLPDLAQTFVRLANVRDRLAPHESFHFPGYTLTGDELVAGITRAARRRGLLAPDREPGVQGLPWPLIRIAGLVNPMLQELAKMSYLWRQPHRLVSERLPDILGAIPRTPLDAALDTTLAELTPPVPVAVTSGARAA